MQATLAFLDVAGVPLEKGKGGGGGARLLTEASFRCAEKTPYDITQATPCPYLVLKSARWVSKRPCVLSDP